MSTETEPEIIDYGLKSKPDLKRPNWSSVTIRIGDREIDASCAIERQLLDIVVRLKPKNQEDWKAIYWLFCWGLKPSEVERVVVRRQNGFAYMWGEPKDGVQPE